MIKTVVVEYVGIEDVQEIMDDAFALMREGHYVNVGMCNLSDNDIRVAVTIKLGGWEADKKNDYAFSFYMDDDCNNVKEMNNCKVTLKNLLTWNEVDAATVEGEVFA